MARIEKTVFVSYRRTNAPWALAIFQDLTQHGYDVFFDFNGIASGDFESVILGNIKSRAHFLVLLTPSALKRCSDRGDWLRREIETALNTQRNVVPLMLEGFDFKTPAIKKQLTGKLSALKKYNALDVPAEYFAEAMDRLRQKYLNIPLDAVLHPASHSARRAAKGQQAAADTAPSVSKKELTAQQWFERGFEAVDLDERLRFYSQAIHLKPDHASAFYNRGLTRQDMGNLEGALRDYNAAIRLKPDDSDAFINRGLVRQEKGDLKGALLDYNAAIGLKPDDPDAFINRGNARSEKGDLRGAIRDYSEAIRLNPGDAAAYFNRGDARYEKGDLKDALRDYTKAIRLNPDYPEAFNNRGIVREDKGDLGGALQDYSAAIRLNPEYADAFYNRALIFQGKASYEAAIADFQKYLENGGGVEGGDQREVERTIRDLTKKAETMQSKIKTTGKTERQKKRTKKKPGEPIH